MKNSDKALFVFIFSVLMFFVTSTFLWVVWNNVVVDIIFVTAPITFFQSCLVSLFFLCMSLKLTFDL